MGYQVYTAWRCIQDLTRSNKCNEKDYSRRCEIKDIASMCFLCVLVLDFLVAMSLLCKALGFYDNHY